MARNRANTHPFVSIGKVLEKILVQHRRSHDSSLLQIWDIWEACVGPAIAANARPVAFKEDLLLVHVRSSTWLHHLHFLEKEVLAKVNAALGGARIRHLKLKIGAL